ncbi:MBL fold metallo-hydrolase [Bacillus solimangrovi]|uniref:MBL fold metallo-hydrolase n=1 Tax=Bacillus solimangrovi TaxID=1305675 RepID=A0A1E5LET3_9BACI|nr:MBL fold metallo-hydrolase [Bacillus solimangrovi]OEH92589.1 MBL fold metallo-hydrolase [Bacillus solimangrovi]
MLQIEEQNGVKTVKGTVTAQGVSISVYMYFVDGMLIDTSTVQLQRWLIPFYEEHNIDMVSLTHWHEDHTGTAAWLQKNKDIPIHIHPMSIEICRQPASYAQYRKKFWGVREPFEALPYDKKVESRSRSWDVIHTPGHSADHVSLYEAETGILFSGDLFVSPKPKLILKDESIPLTIATIRNVLTYDFEEMFCSHSGYHHNGRKVLQNKLNCLEELSGEIIHLHEQGLSMNEINQEIYPRPQPMQALSNGEWDSIHIVRSVLGEYV